VVNHGTLRVEGGLSVTGGLHNAIGARLEISGLAAASIVNDGETVFRDRPFVVGSYLNRRLAAVEGADLTVLGSLTSAGHLEGDSAPGGRAAITVTGDVTMIGDATMSLPELTLTVEGDSIATLTEGLGYDLIRTGLRMAGAGARHQTIEVMSRDLGPDAAGLEPHRGAHFPLGELRIGPAGTTVSLVDRHDN
jgi:hypothetical protein